MFVTAINTQRLQVALREWRKTNPWADGIDYAQFPPKYKDEIETKAYTS